MSPNGESRKRVPPRNDASGADRHDDDDERTAPSGDGFDPAVGRGLLDAEMGPSSAMAHLYRGEVHRMKFWRERLDRTTNWAVIVLAAVLTWAFSQEGTPTTCCSSGTSCC